MYNILFKIILLIPVIFIFSFFGFYSTSSDELLGLTLVAGGLTALFSPLFLWCLYKRITKKKTYSTLENIGITISLVSIILLILGILMFMSLGAAMSNIHY